MARVRVLVSRVAWRGDDGQVLEAFEGEEIDLPQSEVDRFIFNEVEVLKPPAPKPAAKAKAAAPPKE